ncbi:hypothetical protein RHECNPAF_280046 [Rhizobium etli CNPAF512]|nr:hypothetical protein RHECNPAF_280046 [Rhizobium etli CNPAF512]
MMTSVPFYPWGSGPEPARICSKPQPVGTERNAAAEMPRQCLGVRRVTLRDPCRSLRRRRASSGRFR